MKIPNLGGPSSIKTAREQSFQVNGPRLFNSLPKHLKNLTNITVDEFKENLDKFLEKIPDEPQVSGLIPTANNQFTMTPSNSILEQIRNNVKRRPGAI